MFGHPPGLRSLVLPGAAIGMATGLGIALVLDITGRLVWRRLVSTAISRLQ